MYEKNIMAVYERAASIERLAGIEWYPNAHDLASKLAEGNTVVGAGVIAALSPNQSWPRNIELAEYVLRYKRYTGTYGNATRKAKQIVKGAYPLDVLGGNNTRNFFECIYYAGNTGAVCVDRHAIGICLGRIATEKERSNVSLNHGVALTRYAAYANAYRQCAKRLNLKPSELQAITWIQWRKENGIEEKYGF